MIAKIVIGRLRRPRGHFVGTKFLFVGGPFIPLESMYVVNESSQSDRWGRNVTLTYRHYPMAMSWSSVVLGYLRVWLLLLAFAAPFVLMYGEPVDFSRPELLVSVALFLAWLLAMTIPAIVPHRLDGDAGRLEELTGICLDPENMEDLTRAALRTMLIERAGVPVQTPGQVREASAGYDERTRSYVWGACYLLGFADPVWREVADTLGA